MNVYEVSTLRERLAGNRYPGRGIVVGKTADGKKAAAAYFIMGRSANSRNRVFAEEQGAVYTKPFDASKVEMCIRDRGKIKALDDVSVDINQGDVMVVIGPSGSGKSTFLRSLNLLEVPTEGSIIFEGVDITKKKVPDASGKLVKLDLDKHRQRMGMVFQHFNLFPHKTVLENLTIAPMQVKKMPKEQAEAKAMALLERVGLADRAGTYPIQLSGGQKQRIAIVRALMMEPQVMLFDEPTSALRCV